MNNWIYFWFMLSMFFAVCTWVGYLTIKIVNEPAEALEH